VPGRACRTRWISSVPLMPGIKWSVRQIDPHTGCLPPNCRPTGGYRAACLTAGIGNARRSRRPRMAFGNGGRPQAMHSCDSTHGVRRHGGCPARRYSGAGCRNSARSCLRRGIAGRNAGSRAADLARGAGDCASGLHDAAGPFPRSSGAYRPFGSRLSARCRK